MKKNMKSKIIKKINFLKEVCFLYKKNYQALGDFSVKKGEVSWRYSELTVQASRISLEQ